MVASLYCKESVSRAMGENFPQLGLFLLRKSESFYLLSVAPFIFNIRYGSGGGVGFTLTNLLARVLPSFFTACVLRV